MYLRAHAQVEEVVEDFRECQRFGMVAVARSRIRVTTLCSSFEMIVSEAPVISMRSRSVSSGQRAKSRSISA